MTRDFDLARAILLAIEKEQKSPPEPFQIEISGRSADEIAFHVMLLADAGFIEAADFSTEHSRNWKPKRLTPAGKEFLDAVRNEKAWERAKELTLERCGGLSLLLLREAGVTTAENP